MWRGGPEDVEVVWRLWGSGLEAEESWFRGCGEMVWRLWISGPKATDR